MSVRPAYEIVGLKPGHLQQVPEGVELVEAGDLG
jgi:hypothetical protein